MKDPTHDFDRPFVAPFLYHDHRNVYYVTTTREWVTLTQTTWVGATSDEPAMYQPPPIVFGAREPGPHR